MRIFCGLGVHIGNGSGIPGFVGAIGMTAAPCVQGQGGAPRAAVTCGLQGAAAILVEGASKAGAPRKKESRPKAALP